MIDCALGQGLTIALMRRRGWFKSNRRNLLSPRIVQICSYIACGTARERVENDSSYVIRRVIRNTNRGGGTSPRSTGNGRSEVLS